MGWGFLMCIIPYQSLVYMVGVHWGLTGDFDFLSVNLTMEHKMSEPPSDCATAVVSCTNLISDRDLLPMSL